jgi:hypothetical protein
MHGLESLPNLVRLHAKCLLEAAEKLHALFRCIGVEGGKVLWLASLMVRSKVGIHTFASFSPIISLLG